MSTLDIEVRVAVDQLQAFLDSAEHAEATTELYCALDEGAHAAQVAIELITRLRSEVALLREKSS